MQNNVHLKWLRRYLDVGIDFPLYSYIVFSDRCELKKITLTSNNHIVINRRNLFLKIRINAEQVGNKLSHSEIDTFYERLFLLTQVTEEQKELHIKSIQQKRTIPIGSSFSESPISRGASSDFVPISSLVEQKKCPRCGGVLVLRSAKKGARAGKFFYGCSNFPACHYIENID